MHAQSGPTLCPPMDSSLPGFLCLCDSSGKNTGGGCHALLQEIFLTQGSNICLLCLLHWWEGSLPAALPGSLYPFTCVGHVRRFCVLAIMNTEVHGSFQSRMYSRCMRRNWIAGSYGSFSLFLWKPAYCSP